MNYLKHVMWFSDYTHKYNIYSLFSCWQNCDQYYINLIRIEIGLTLKYTYVRKKGQKWKNEFLL